MARLTARPHPPSSSLTPGTYTLGLAAGRDGHLLVPSTYDPSTPSPLLLSLHGAGIDGTGPLNFLGPYAQGSNFVLLAPDSRGSTWDAIQGSFGPDVAYIDRALGWAFDRCAVDPSRVYIEGFSDGASYCLGLGEANGDLFARMIAFSPGFVTMSDSPPQGKPAIFVSHGAQDPVLSATYTKNTIVPSLLNGGYSVTFVEYDGVHSVTPDVAKQAIDWMLQP